ncbi:hypothetical protein HOY80DRAFT_980556 [Tuber brumale]|nr:hypothetical protein HOY80DRAFT_980556 [Tuber brumale]
MRTLGVSSSPFLSQGGKGEAKTCNSGSLLSLGEHACTAVFLMTQPTNWGMGKYYKSARLPHQYWIVFLFFSSFGLSFLASFIFVLRRCPRGGTTGDRVSFFFPPSFTRSFFLLLLRVCWLEYDTTCMIQVCGDDWV